MKRLTAIALSLSFLFVCNLYAQTSESLNLVNASDELGVRNAKLAWAWAEQTKENAQVRERKLFLSFQLPQSQLDSSVTLKAFSKDGTVKGQSVWCPKTLRTNYVELKGLDNSMGEVALSMEVDPSLGQAARYVLSIAPSTSFSEPPLETCAECAQVASGVCGNKGVKSMTCGGTTGQCIFVCRD